MHKPSLNDVRPLVLLGLVGSLLNLDPQPRGWQVYGRISVGLLLFFSFVFSSYYRILQGSKSSAGSPEHQEYTALYGKVARGGSPTLLYAGLLTALLDAVDRLCGDRDQITQPRMPGATKPITSVGQLANGASAYPTWTTPAFDFCLLLALFYPIAVVFLVWVYSGHIGSAEKALLLGTEPPWQRIAGLALIAGELAAFWRAGTEAKNRRWRKGLAYFAVSLVAAIVAFFFAGTVTFVGAVPFVIAADRKVAGAVGVAFVFTFGVALDIAGNAVAAHSASAFVPLFVPLDFLAFLVAFGVAFVVGVAARHYVRNNRYRVFIRQFVMLMLFGCLTAALTLSQHRLWNLFGPFLMFVCLLTLLNAPFDWLSLGLTRALLRAGLKKEGWRPYAFALLDMALTVVIVGLLSCIMVLGVQSFDLFAIRLGDKPILPLETIFMGIRDDGWNAGYFWIYTLLVTTMIPSAVNSVLGCTAFVRALPPMTSYLKRHMPTPKGTITEHRRILIALALTAQWAVGGLLGLAATCVFILVIVLQALPKLGIGLLEIVRALAALNLPQYIVALVS